MVQNPVGAFDGLYSRGAVEADPPFEAGMHTEVEVAPHYCKALMAH